MKNTEQREYKQVGQRVWATPEETTQSRSNKTGIIEHNNSVVPVSIFSPENALAVKLALDPVLDPCFNTGVQVADIKRTEKRKRTNFEKFEARKRYNGRLADCLLPSKYGMADAIRNCSNKIVEIVHEDGNTRILADHYCSKRFCAICANRRTRALILRYSEKIEQFTDEKYAYHFVFTYRNMDKLLSRRQISKHIRNVFRRSIWNKYSNSTFTKKDSVHVAGAIYSIETTYNLPIDNFHPHVHCLVVLDRPLKTYRKGNKELVDIFSFKNELQEVWREVTESGTDGENFVVYGEKWKRGHVAELLKYATKLEKQVEGEQQQLSDMPKHRLDELIEWTTGHRQISALGGLYNYTIGIDKEIEQQIASEMVKDQFTKTDHTRIDRTFDHEKKHYVEIGRTQQAYKLPDGQQAESIAQARSEKLLIRLKRLDVRIDRRELQLKDSRRVIANAERSEWYVSATGELTATGILKEKFEEEAKKQAYQITSLLKKRKAYQDIYEKVAV